MASVVLTSSNGKGRSDAVAELCRGMSGTIHLRWKELAIGTWPTEFGEFSYEVSIFLQLLEGIWHRLKRISTRSLWPPIQVC